MDPNEILEIFSKEYIFNERYHGYLYGAEISDRKDAVENEFLKLSEEDSLEGLCILVFGSIDNLPEDIPKPENPYQGLPVAYMPSSKFRTY